MAMRNNVVTIVPPVLLRIRIEAPRHAVKPLACDGRPRVCPDGREAGDKPIPRTPARTAAWEARPINVGFAWDGSELSAAVVQVSRALKRKRLRSIRPQALIYRSRE
jgi:hypothetical protein